MGVPESAVNPTARNRHLLRTSLHPSRLARGWIGCPPFSLPLRGETGPIRRVSPAQDTAASTILLLDGRSLPNMSHALIDGVLFVFADAAHQVDVAEVLFQAAAELHPEDAAQCGEEQPRVELTGLERIERPRQQPDAHHPI